MKNTAKYHNMVKRTEQARHMYIIKCSKNQVGNMAIKTTRNINHHSYDNVNNSSISRIISEVTCKYQTWLSHMKYPGIIIIRKYVSRPSTTLIRHACVLIQSWWFSSPICQHVNSTVTSSSAMAERLHNACFTSIIAFLLPIGGL